MKGSEKPLVKYMDGPSNRFVIPVYQRNYDWKKENCKQLFNDLIKIVKERHKNHFFGSIVSVYNPDGCNTEYLIIDGQQRLTTVSLILLAMYNIMADKTITKHSNNLGDKILDWYLVDKYEAGEKRIKLKPVKNDQLAFVKLFEHKDEYIEESNVTINYRYFYDRIKLEEVSLDELFDAIHKLQIIDITLNDDDNPQLIFESLNSTGLALSEGDKIRNYILMNLPRREQDIYYEKYWNKIEVCTKYDVSTFIRDYLTLKMNIIPSINKVYSIFKQYVEKDEIQTEVLLSDMLEYSRLYQHLLNSDTLNREINASLARLNRLEMTVVRPFFMEVLMLIQRETLNPVEAAKIFQSTESYIFRRLVCSMPTNALKKVFSGLHSAVMRYDGTSDNYVNKVHFELLTKKGTARFPLDDEFIEAFKTYPVYSMNGKNKLYILERFENFGTTEDKDIYRHLDDGDYSIEHIMPQQMTKEWVDALGADYKHIHEEWLHRVANLTLTAYNSTYSNKAFDKKKNAPNGFIESGLRLNTYIARQDKWTLEELEARNEHLMSRSLEIWSCLKSDFVPKERHLDEYSLDDDIDFSGRKLYKFNYQGIDYPVSSWTQMYRYIIRQMYEDDASILMRMVYEVDTENNYKVFSNNNNEESPDYTQIAPNLFVKKHMQTNSKIRILRNLFKAYGKDTTELFFFVSEEPETDESE